MPINGLRWVLLSNVDGERTDVDAPGTGNGGGEIGVVRGPARGVRIEEFMDIPTILDGNNRCPSTEWGMQMALVLDSTFLNYLDIFYVVRHITRHKLTNQLARDVV